MFASTQRGEPRAILISIKCLASRSIVDACFLEGRRVAELGGLCERESDRRAVEEVADPCCKAQLGGQGRPPDPAGLSDCGVVCSLIVRQDERGIEGVVIVPEGKRRKVRIGTQLSASAVKQREHEEKEGMQTMQQKDAAGLQVKSNTKAGVVFYFITLLFGFFRFFFDS